MWVRIPLGVLTIIMHYIVQENTFREENYNNLILSLDRLNLSYEIVKVLPFIETFDFNTKTKNNFVFEKFLSPDSIVILEKSGEITIKEVVDKKLDEKILSFDENNNEIVYADILNRIKNEETNEWLEIELESGEKITVTPNHRIFTTNGDIKAENLKIGDNIYALLS